MLKVKLLHPAAKVPIRANETDAGLDLYALEDSVIYPMSWEAVPTGIAISIPEGYAGFIRPRSGLAVKSAIDILAGVIDSSFRGQVKAVLVNHGALPFRINSGDRIAQLVIQKVELWTPVVVDEQKANARRLVACWNACDCVSTESLETGELNVSDLAERDLNLSDERDELVKALRKVVEWNNKYPSSRVFSYSEIAQIAKEMDEISNEAAEILARYPTK